MKLIIFILLFFTLLQAQSDFPIKSDIELPTHSDFIHQSGYPFGIQQASLMPFQVKRFKSNQLIGNITKIYADASYDQLSNCYIFPDTTQNQNMANPAQKRKNRKVERLQKLADRFTVEELQSRIRQYESSKKSGIVLMGVGIPLFAGGALAYIVAMINKDNSDSDGYDNDEDTGWLITALVGEIIGGVGGILTAYGVIKTSKANSRVKRYQQLLEIKQDKIGLRFDRNSLSFCYSF